MARAIGGLFGGRSDASQRIMAPTSFISETPALRLNSGISAGGDVTSRLTRLGSPVQTAFDERFPRMLQDIDNVRGTIKPGFSLMRQARSQAVENARNRSVGNLKENLQRRRVLGSSFGGDAVARTEREFAELDAEQQATAFVEEFTANLQVLQQESAEIAAGLDRELRELGISSTQGAQLMQAFTQANQAQAAMRSREQESQLGFGREVLGAAVGAAATGFTGGFSAPRFATSGFGNGRSQVPMGGIFGRNFNTSQMMV